MEREQNNFFSSSSVLMIRRPNDLIAAYKMTKVSPTQLIHNLSRRFKLDFNLFASIIELHHCTNPFVSIKHR